MRKIIAAMQMSLDGFIEGPNGELDWVDTWGDTYGLIPQIDMCILGGGMYPDYEQYWLAILSNPEGILSFRRQNAPYRLIHEVRQSQLEDDADHSRHRRNPKHEATA